MAKKKVKVLHVEFKPHPDSTEEFIAVMKVAGERDPVRLLALSEDAEGIEAKAKEYRQKLADLMDEMDKYERFVETMQAAAAWVRKQNGPRTRIERRYGCTLRIYDKADCFDRYTLVPPRWASQYKVRRGLWNALAASENPFHPQGFGQHVEVAPGHWLGARIKWSELPEKVQKWARQEYPEFCPPVGK